MTANELGIVTDELTESLEEALDFISSYHLRWCELRSVWGLNIMNLPSSDLDRAKRLLTEHGVRVSDIASPVFKWNLPRRATPPSEARDTFQADFTEEDARALLEKSFQLAHFFDTDKVRIFSYWRLADPIVAYPFIRDRLAEAAQQAAENDIVLLVENEHACNVGTGAELGQLLRDVNSPNLRGIWDPGNAVLLGEVPFPDGFHSVQGLFPHMHIKDVRNNPQTEKLEWAPVGGGVIDYKGQFEALRENQFTGTMSLETHYRRPDGDKIESTRESLEGLLRFLS